MRHPTIHSLIKFCKLFGIFFIISLLINSCSNSCSSCNTCTSSTNTTTNLGTLPNGSAVNVSSYDFSISSTSSTTTGSIGITGGEAGYTGILTASIARLSRNKLNDINVPGITLTPSPCILIAGNTEHLSCKLTITVESSVQNGKYFVTPVFQPESSQNSITLNNFSITVSNQQVSAGNLTILVESQTLISGESSVAIVTLSNSSNVTNLITNLTSSNTGIISLNGGTSCTLSTESNICHIPYIAGSQKGTATISANASGYTEVTSNPINVNQEIIPGTLGITILQSSLLYGESTTGTVRLTDSLNLESLTVTISSANESIATVEPTSCILSSAESSCNIIVTAKSESGFTKIDALATSYTPASSNITVLTPADIYFATNNGLVYKGYDLLEADDGINPDGTSITTIVSSSNSLYLGTQGGSVYTESLGQGVWYQIGGTEVAPNSEVTAIAFSSSLIYAAVYSYLNHSAAIYIESGTGWKLVNESVVMANGKINSIIFRGKVYAGGEQGSGNSDVTTGVVYTESANRWVLINNPIITNGSINSIAISGSVIYAGGFSITTSNLEAGNIAGVVYFNNQSGSGWQLLANSPAIANGRINSVITPGSGTVIYAGGINLANNSAHVVKTSTSTPNWITVGESSGIESNASVKTLISNSDGSTIYAAINSNSNTQGTVYSETNSNWQLFGPGPVTQSGIVNSITLQGSAVYAVTSLGSILKNSVSWSPVVSGAVCQLPITSLLNMSNIIYVSCGNSVYKDQGNWSRISNESVMSNGVINSIAISNNTTISDNSQTTSSSIGMTAPPPVNTIIYAGGQESNSQAVVYDNSLNIWNLTGNQPVMNNGIINSVAMESNGVVAGGKNYMNGAGEVYRKLSAGTWVLVDQAVFNNGTINTVINYKTHLYVGGNDTSSTSQPFVYFESNGSWQIIGGGAVIAIGNLNALSVSGNDIYAAGSDISSIEQGFVSISSNGSNWSLVGGGNIPVEYGSKVTSIAVDINKDVYVATDLNSILFSRGGVSPWLVLPYRSYSSTLSITDVTLFDQ